MEIPKIYQAIAEGNLYHTISLQTRPPKTYLKFKRHHSVFTFVYTPATETREESYVLLKDKEKARLGTLRVMWKDYQELDEGA